MKLVKSIQEYASLIITCIIVLIFGMMMWVGIKGIDNWREPQMWLEMGFNLLLQIVMICTWLPEGRKRGAQDETYVANRDVANTKMKEAAEAENFTYLTAFCKNATEQNRVAWITKRVARYGINYARWNYNEYKNEFSETLRQKVEKIEKASFKRVKEIKATEIVTNSQISLVYDTRDHTNESATVKVTVKMILSFGMCAIGAFIAIDEVHFTLSSFIKFLYWMLVVCLSIFYSIRTGQKLITVDRNDYYKRMIVFLSHFEEWRNEKKQ